MLKVNNNRKLTKARKNQRGRRGYVPNRLRHAYKHLEIYMNELENFDKLSTHEQIEQMEMQPHYKRLVDKYESIIKEYNPDF